MWLYVYDDDDVYVDTETYIDCQPVNYDQVKDVIESLSQPVNAYVDVSRVDLTEVDLVGLVKIVWKLHEKTKDQNLLNAIHFIGATPWMRTVWYALQCVMPSFVRRSVNFVTL